MGFLESENGRRNIALLYTIMNEKCPKTWKIK